MQLFILLFIGLRIASGCSWSWEAMAEFIDVQQRLSNGEDAAEGVRSFVGKRPARFMGR